MKATLYVRCRFFYAILKVLEITLLCIVFLSIGGIFMPEFDDVVLKCFLENQSQLFPEGDVCETIEEAEDFLQENLAIVVNSIDEVMEFFEEEGLDLEGLDEDSILEADEVFEIGDGRFLIIEG